MENIRKILYLKIKSPEKKSRTLKLNQNQQHRDKNWTLFTAFWLNWSLLWDLPMKRGLTHLCKQKFWQRNSLWSVMRQSHKVKWTGVREAPVRGLQPGHQRVIVGKLMATWQTCCHQLRYTNTVLKCKCVRPNYHPSLPALIPVSSPPTSLLSAHQCQHQSSCQFPL